MSSTAKPSRRLWLAGAAIAGVVLGAGGFLWRQRQSAADDGAALWSVELETPSGGRLALASLRGQALVVNFWATWCAPCVREMPALDRFHREFSGQGWQVVGVAADNAAPVREFLTRTPVSFPVGLAGFAGVELSRQLGNLSGGLPFTLIYGRDGRLLRRHIGETRYEQLAAWAKGIS